MVTSIRLAALVLALLLVPQARSAPLRIAAPDPAEATVRLRLNALETSELLGRYRTLVRRELSLQDSVRACLKSGEDRLHEYQQALQETQDDLANTKKRLVTLETEKTRLNERLGRKAVSAPAVESSDRSLRILKELLERLDRIEKQMEKSGQRR
jgi:hypothetical protein